MRLLKLVPDNTKIGFVRVRHLAFILTALLLAIACGISGAAAARTPGHTYMQVSPTWGQLRGAQMRRAASCAPWHMG